MKTTLSLAVLATLGLTLTGCGGFESDGEHAHGPDSHDHAPTSQLSAEPGDTHVHADGSTHDNHAAGATTHTDGAGDHPHHDDEVALPAATLGDMTLELAQGHGAIKAGEESHLVVKLPYNDNGATLIRAWIGTEDRTLSFVGKGEYTPSHDDYDLHAMAPDRLPDNTMWWIEIEKPDGTKVVGSAVPILE